MITGAASGMGAACARRLAPDHRLFLLDLRPDPLEAVAEELADADTSVLTFSGDVGSAKDVHAAVQECLDRLGGLDVAVNAAGILEPTAFFEITTEEWDRMLRVNLTGAFLVTQEVARPMRDRGWGRIVHFSSTAGKTVSTLGGAHYTVSKHGVLGLTRAAAAELGRFGITVNAVCPGLIDTEMVRSTVSTEKQQAYARGFPITRLGTPEEVAELVRFLASDEAAYITGAGLDINGGDLMV
jgi:NAD(P)-dependent dehydrogenase (short-subunit alcohol dehydrogenase family)